MSNASYIALISAVATVLSTLITAVVAYMMARLQKVARDTHTLVNSNMEIQLRLNMELSEWKANLTGLPIDREAAQFARHKYEEHLRRQQQVDKGELR